MIVLSRRTQVLMVFGLVFALGCTLLFVRLGTGPIEVYDEGLYGMYGRNAMHSGQWLHAVDEKGAFPTGGAKFSKPPLVLGLVAASFKLFGPSLFALRLPFALSSLLIALICLAWGMRIGGPTRGISLGVGWSMLWLTCYGTYHYGRTATIEPVLIAFVMLALWAHSTALSRSGWAQFRWALLSSLGLVLAFFTKQLVCVLAALPIAMVELSRFRSERRLRWFLRNALVLGLPTLSALGWIYVVWRKVGKAAKTVLWEHAVANRVAGYEGHQHQNYLNRVTTHLDLNAPPFAWQLGLLGIGLCIASLWRRGRGKEPDAWLIAGCLFVAWLAFDVGSQSILPWYAMTLLPSLAFGNAWLISHALESVRAESGENPFERLAAGAGAACLLWLVSASARDFMPAVLAAALCAAALTFFLARAPLRVWPTLAALLAGLAVILIGSFARPTYAFTEADPLSTLGVALRKLHAKRVILDSRVKTHAYVRRTFFGSLSEPGSAPWKVHRPTDRPPDAFVEMRALPREIRPKRGVKLMRAGGCYAAFGKVSSAPFELAELEATLAKGKLTFEAEHMASERFDSLQSDPAASGWRTRRIGSRPWDRNTKAALVRSSTIELPKGEYTATFWIALQCSGENKDVLGSISVSPSADGEHDLRCDRKTASQSGRYLPIKLPVQLYGSGSLQVAITRKKGEIAFDRMELRLRPKPPDQEVKALTPEVEPPRKRTRRKPQRSAVTIGGH